MKDEARISANTAPADAVLPEAQAGVLGVVMLDTRFPRPPGDVGHPDTFGRPVRQRIVPGAWPREVVASAQALRQSKLVPAFVEAIRELESEGVAAVTTSCGFLVLLQCELQAAVRVPVVTSSLLLLPRLLAAERRVGVLTIDAERLSEEYFLAAGVDAARMPDVVVEGVRPNGEFARAILGNHESLDLVRAQADVVDAALRLRQRAPDVTHVVLECTNMPPYADAVQAATGFRLYDLRDALHL